MPRIRDFGFDLLKIASAPVADWSLLEAAATGLPMVVSTARLETPTLDRVVRYLNRYASTFAPMHCVSLYPTPTQFLNLQRMGQLQKRYPRTPVGYPTHESPDNDAAAGMAIALGQEFLSDTLEYPEINHR